MCADSHAACPVQPRRWSRCRGVAASSQPPHLPGPGGTFLSSYLHARLPTCLTMRQDHRRKEHWLRLKPPTLPLSFASSFLLEWRPRLTCHPAAASRAAIILPSPLLSADHVLRAPQPGPFGASYCSFGDFLGTDSACLFFWSVSLCPFGLPQQHVGCAVLPIRCRLSTARPGERRGRLGTGPGPWQRRSSPGWRPRPAGRRARQASSRRPS